MGMYTEFSGVIQFKKDTPLWVYDTIECLSHTVMFDALPLESCDVFKGCRCLFAYGDSTLYKSFGEFDFFTEFKNYDNEIDKFLSLIKPYVNNMVKVTTRYEDDDYDLRIYIKDGEYVYYTVFDEYNDGNPTSEVLKREVK